MSRNKSINKPFDFAFGMLYNEYPKELHEELGIPGIFRRKSNVKVRLKDGRVLEMDASYVVDPDNEVLFEPAVVNLEHRSTAVDKPKIIIIGDYNIQQIADERLPPINVIASHLNEEKSVKEHHRTPTHATKLMFLDLGPQNNQERLNRLRNKINYNEDNLSVNDVINLGIIALFAPRQKANTIIRQVVLLYVKIKNKPKKLEYALYSVIAAMVDAYCDDEKEFEELMNLINNETEEEMIGEFETQIMAREKIIELEEEIEASSNKMNQVVSENNQLVSENSILKQRIKELENQSNNK